jgi:molybdenum cofactor synthesis domain-containing protein
VRTVSILIIGDEILSGEIADVNAPYAIGRLSADGVKTVRQVIVPDDVGEIVGELTRLRAMSDAIIVSGGIGPTHDDVTRPAVSQAWCLPLEEHGEARRRIEGFYRDRVTEAELSMAMMPRGATLVDGAKTGAFGFALPGLYVLPGVPFLFRDLVEGFASDFHAPPLHKVEICTELREGEIAPILSELQCASPDVAIGSYPVFADGVWHVRVVLRSEDETALEAAAEAIRPQLEP